MPVAIGAHYFGPEAASTRLRWRTGPNTIQRLREVFTLIGGWALADTPGGRDELAQLVDPALRDLVDQPSPASPPLAESFASRGMLAGRNATGLITAMRVHDAAGRLAGTVMIAKPAAGMGVLATMAAGGDLRHFERMQRVAKPARRPAAILFADLEGSSSLARRLSTASYFALGLDPDRITCTPLAGLCTATEKARRDAPAIAVCEV